MMESFGIENIRSDVFPNKDLDSSQLAYISNLFKYKVVTSFIDLICLRCGRRGHCADVCYIQSDVNCKVLDQVSDTSSSSSSD